MLWSKMYAKQLFEMAYDPRHRPAKIVYSAFCCYYLLCLSVSVCVAIVLITLVITAALIRTSHTAMATLWPDSTV